MDSQEDKRQARHYGLQIIQEEDKFLSSDDHSQELAWI